MNNAVTILALQDAKLSNNNKELHTLCLRLSINFHSEQVADAPSIIPLNTCLYIYFIFRFRRMLNRNVLESLNEILFNRRNNVIDTISGYSATQVQPFPFELSSRTRFFLHKKGTVIPSLLIRRCVCHSCSIRAYQQKQPNADVTKNVVPSRILSKLRAC